MSSDPESGRASDVTNCPICTCEIHETNSLLECVACSGYYCETCWTGDLCETCMEEDR